MPFGDAQNVILKVCPRGAPHLALMADFCVLDREGGFLGSCIVVKGHVRGDWMSEFPWAELSIFDFAWMNLSART